MSFSRATSGRHRQGAAAVRGDLARRRVDQLGAARGQGDRRALFGRLQRHALAEAARAAGDHHHPAHSSMGSPRMSMAADRLFDADAFGCSARVREQWVTHAFLRRRNGAGRGKPASAGVSNR
ncbi:MAG TPA: hypothetical protein VK325_04185 [Pseudoxanthomonas sp.]|nr:hypothetical protein [Pseudoxanthomonas sp.]